MSILRSVFRSVRSLAPAAGLAIALAPLAAAAADRVRLKSGIVVTGELVAYDERGVAIRTPAGNVARYPADQIGAVEAAISEAHRAGDQAREQGTHVDAVRAYRTALGGEARHWAQARIRTSLVRSLVALGQLAEAGEAFLILVRSRDDLAVMRWAPLVWVPGTSISEDARGAAKTWLAGSAPIAQLIAVSWLLRDEPDRNLLATLDRLQTDPDPRVHWLARAQRFRLTLDTVTDEQITRFHALVAKMPADLQAGPQYLLGLAYEQVDRPVDAALALLSAAYVHHADAPLAPDALWRAAVQSGRAGLHLDAAHLYEQLRREYPGTTWTTKATQAPTPIEPRARP